MNRNQPDISLPKDPQIGIYIAQITQTGTTVPVSTVLKNTTGLDIQWTTRDAPGVYNLSLDGLERIPLITQIYFGPMGPGMHVYTTTTDEGYQISTYQGTTGADEKFNGTSIKIEIHNYL